MSNETAGLSDQSGSDAESALESAARHLRASPRPAGSSPAREILRGRQTRDLLAWARENSRIVEGSELHAEGKMVQPGHVGGLSQGKPAARIKSARQFDLHQTLPLAWAHWKAGESFVIDLQGDAHRARVAFRQDRVNSGSGISASFKPSHKDKY